MVDMFEETKPLNEFQAWVQTEIKGRDQAYKKKACVKLINMAQKSVDPLGDLFKNNKQKFLTETQKGLYPYLDEMFKNQEPELGTSILGTVHAKKMFEMFIYNNKLNRKQMGSVFLEAVMQSPFFTNFEKKRLYQGFDI